MERKNFPKYFVRWLFRLYDQNCFTQSCFRFGFDLSADAPLMETFKEMKEKEREKGTNKRKDYGKVIVMLLSNSSTRIVLYCAARYLVEFLTGRLPAGMKNHKINMYLDSAEDLQNFIANLNNQTNT